MWRRQLWLYAGGLGLGLAALGLPLAAGGPLAADVLAWAGFAGWLAMGVLALANAGIAARAVLAKAWRWRRAVAT